LNRVALRSINHWVRFGLKLSPIWLQVVALDRKPHPPAAAYARRFAGQYEHRELKGGIGHNLPQEAPAAFAQAVIDVSRA